MPRRITAKIDTYEKDGETKGQYIGIGVIMDGQYGEYVLLNPTIDLAGVLMRQRILDPSKASKSVLCNIFDDDNRQQAPAKQPEAAAAAGGVDEASIPF